MPKISKSNKPQPVLQSQPQSAITPARQPAAVPFHPDRSAAQADAALRRSLHAVDHAHQCAVLWFADIMCRHL
jgi:hypothetical protein